MTPTPEQIALAIKLRQAGTQREEVIHQSGLTKARLDRLIKEGVIPRISPDHPRIVKPVPPRFAETYRDNSLEGCAAIFHVSKETASRWARELGLKREPGRTIAQERGIKPPPRQPNRFLTAARAPISRAVMDEAGRAAEYLRPDYIPTYRCDEDGRPNPTGRMYRCGKRVFTPAEVVARAAEVKARRARMQGAAA